MPLDLSAELLAIIVCPDCHGDLLPVEAPGGVTPGRHPGKPAEPMDGELVCQSCGLAYPVRDGIPVLLVDEARRPD